MNSFTFREILDLLMCSDPWPVKGDGENQRKIILWINGESKGRGYSDWIDAYHNHFREVELENIPVREYPTETATTAALIQAGNLVTDWMTRDEPLELNSAPYLKKIEEVLKNYNEVISK